jgi:hypothetical protein
VFPLDWSDRFRQISFVDLYIFGPSTLRKMALSMYQSYLCVVVGVYFIGTNHESWLGANLGPVRGMV